MIKLQAGWLGEISLVFLFADLMRLSLFRAKSGFYLTMSSGEARRVQRALSFDNHRGNRATTMWIDIQKREKGTNENYRR
jgi:hypothetical protein